MSRTSDPLSRLLTTLDAAWTAFQDSYAGLADEQLLEPGVTGEWSVRDVMAHVSWWEVEALKHLPVILASGRPPRYSTTYGGIDAFNAQMAEEWRDRSLVDVRHRLLATHRRLVDYLHQVPPDHLRSGTRFRRRLRLDTYGHYPLHTQAIQEWRARRPGGKAQAKGGAW